MTGNKPSIRLQTITTSTRFVLLLLIVCVLLFAFGCGKKEKPQEPENSNDSTVTPTSQDTDKSTSSQAEDVVPLTADSDTEVVVKLLDPGARPRSPLRYKFQAGRTETMVMEMKMSTAMEMGGQKAPETKSPPSEMTMTIESKEVSPQGDLRYEFKLKKADVIPDPNANPMMVGAMKQSLNSMVGMNGTVTVTSRGFTKDTDIKMPDGINPQVAQSMGNMHQSMSQMSAPFPAEPVGIGGRWQVSMPLETNGMKIKQTATYELVEIRGDKVKFNVTIKQTADPQEMSMPGTKVSLESLKSSGNGTVETTLTDLVPTSNIDITTNGVVSTNNQKINSTTRIAMKIHPG
jgi:hypothetical protein